MRDNGEHLCTTLLEHVEDALHGEESVRVLFLADALEEDWQVVVVVQGHDVDLPLDPVLRTVLDADRQVSSVVETAEFRWGHLSSFNGTSHRLGWSSLLWSLCSREGLAADSLTLLESCKHRHKVTSSHSEKERVFKSIVKLTLFRSSLLSCSCRSGSRGALLLWHVSLGEITKDRVLGLWEELVLRALP